MDFLGILGGMMFSGFGFLYFCFYCYTSYVIVWSWLTLLLGTYLVIWVWNRLSKRLAAETLIPCDRFPEFSFSLCLFITFASFVPVFAAWAVLNDHASRADLRTLLLEATACDVLVSIGVFVFAQGGVPERFLSPNICDMVGHSHQIWHFITGTVMFLLTKNSVAYYLARAGGSCLGR
jgi:predicted membrane channel-forming protein YqfA (hemolysin III family)